MAGTEEFDFSDEDCSDSDIMNELLAKSKTEPPNPDILFKFR